MARTYVSWDKFKTAMVKRYDKTTICNDLLRQQLEKVRFEEPSKIIEYCAAFRTIEQLQTALRNGFQR
jgi:hypothetical protein